MPAARLITKAEFIASGGAPYSTTYSDNATKEPLVEGNIILEIFEDWDTWNQLQTHAGCGTLRKDFIQLVCGGSENPGDQYYRDQNPSGLGLHRAKVDYKFLKDIRRKNWHTGLSTRQKEWLESILQRCGVYEIDADDGWADAADEADF